MIEWRVEIALALLWWNCFPDHIISSLWSLLPKLFHSVPFSGTWFYFHSR